MQETHKSPHGVHRGYWSFESGALVKILGLDDSILLKSNNIIHMIWFIIKNLDFIIL
ncbi:PoNe immunity protein domain-containing protein [Neisseria leonii]|uniref:PoNe immunity protein domain-containing protein n=1 Tax=Neisseria leonii TaxID=2995413 RepID=UPI0034606A1D